MKDKIGLSLCAWAYNERELIDWFVEKADRDLRKVTDDYEIIVVDDCSTDGTWEKLGRLKEKFPKLKVVRHEVNKDVGYGYRTTTPRATKEVIFYDTIDMIFDTEDIPLFLPYLENYDLLQGVRTDLRANTPFRQWTTLVNYYLIRVLFGVPMNEFQNVKFVKRELIKQITFESSSIFTNAEIAIKVYYLGARIKEVKMTYGKRKKGKQKGARLKSLWLTFRDIFYFWFQWVVLGRVKKVKQFSKVDAVRMKHW